MIYYPFDRAVLKSYNLYESFFAAQRCICYGFWRNLLIYMLKCVTVDGAGCFHFPLGGLRVEVIAIVFSVSGGGSLISSCLISQLQQVNTGLHLDTHHLDTDDQKGPFPSNSLDSLIPRLQASSAVLMKGQENDYFQLSSEASDLPLDKKSIPFFFMVSQTLGDISVSETVEVSENVVTYLKSQCIMEHKMTYTA